MINILHLLLTIILIFLILIYLFAMEIEHKGKKLPQCSYVVYVVSRPSL